MSYTHLKTGRISMRPRESEATIEGNQKRLFEQRLDSMLDRKHPLFQLANKINWKNFDEKLGAIFVSKTGRPATPTRLIVGLLYLKHSYNHSDEELISRFQENPYWQYFCGFHFFHQKAPCDSSVLSKWRKRMGEENLSILLEETLAQALELKILKPKELEDVIVDTTVQEKNITFPTDMKLVNRARESLIREAKLRGFVLRQTYCRESKMHLIKYSGYAHAKQFSRAKKILKRMKTILGRVIRDIERQYVNGQDDKFDGLLDIAKKILIQERKDKNKIYSVHEPDVECITKGKAHKRYEFGCKASIMTTNKSNWIIGAKALHGRPYDGHTIPDVLDQAKKIVGKLPFRIYADKGYRGASPPVGVNIFISGQKRGLDKKTKRLLKRRSAVEPIIGHLKDGNRMRRNFLKGIDGDKINVILAAAGRNFAKLMAFFFVSNLWTHFLQNFFI